MESVPTAFSGCIAFMRLIRAVCWLAMVAFPIASTSAYGNTKPQLAALADALARLDHQAITRAVAVINESAAARQGVPEVADQFTRIPFNTTVLTNAEALASAATIAAQIERGRWWRIGLDPTQLSHPLREPASAIIGLLALSRALQPKNTLHTTAQDAYINAAREAGNFLVWAQSQAGAGLYPFPAFKGNTNQAAFRAMKGRLSRIEKNGLNHHFKNGWLVEDFFDGDNSGGLQFDNGECGIAMFALYEATQDKKYLDSALRAAEWAARRSLVTNWNYNSFSVRLLARAYLVTGNPLFLERATQKALLGVIPGQLVSGENKGRWGDAHNARPTYHYIMMDGLCELVAAMRQAKLDKGDAYNKIINALRLGLMARNPDFAPNGKGAPTKETAMIALLNINNVFAGDVE